MEDNSKESMFFILKLIVAITVIAGIAVYGYINVNETFYTALGLMVKGMLGIFVVIFLIFLSIKLLMKLFPNDL